MPLSRQRFCDFWGKWGLRRIGLPHQPAFAPAPCKIESHFRPVLICDFGVKTLKASSRRRPDPG